MGDLAWCQMALDAMVKGDTGGKGNSYRLGRILPSDWPDPKLSYL